MNNFIRVILALIALIPTLCGIVLGREYIWFILATPQGQLSYLNTLPLYVWLAIIVILWAIAAYSWFMEDD